MSAIRYIQEVAENGVIELNVAKTLGRKVEVVVMSMPDNHQSFAHKDNRIYEKLSDEEQFFALAAQAAIESDSEEDAVWGKYLKRTQL